MSTGFGFKIRDNFVSPDLCVRVYVRKKLKKLAPKRGIPRILPLRVQVHGVRYRFKLTTDVVEAPHVLHARPQALRAPRIFNDNDPDEYGTATAIVAAGGIEYVLSAAHVVGRVLKATNAQPGESISDGQPDKVGALSFVPSVVKSGIDAALVRPLNDRRIDVPRPNGAAVTMICPIEDLIANGPAVSYKVLAYRQFRTAAFHAVIPNYSVAGVYAEGTVTFKQVLQFEVATEGGDSGAMVVDPAGRAVGLHILATSSDTDWAYSIPIGDVLDDLMDNTHLQLRF